MAKKSAAKKTVEEVVKEVKDEGIDVKVVAEEPKAEKDYKDEDVFLHESGQLGYINKDGNFVPV